MMKKTNIQILYMVLDVVFAGLSLFFALSLHYENQIPQNLLSEVVITFPVTASALLFFGLILGCYESVLNYAGISELLRQFVAVVLTYFFLELFRHFGLISFSYAVLIMWLVFTFLLSGGIRVSNRVFRWYLINIKKRSYIRTIIIGGGATAAMLIKRMHESAWNDLYPVAILDDDPQKQGMRVSGVKIVGDSTNVTQAVKKYKAQLVLIAIPSADSDTLRMMYERAKKTATTIKYIKDAFDLQEYLSGNKNALKEISIEDLLSRESVRQDMSDVIKYISGKTVLVTGGAGSIGSELCRQILKYGCEKLVIFDIDENSMFEINEELKQNFPSYRYVLAVGSIRDTERLESVFDTYRPQIVFHSAAHKHVPMMEINICEAIKNNIIGTKNVIDVSKRFDVSKFILISTDKAVNPTNVMGATKRIAELLVQAESNSVTEMAAVRFGNVLGSSGSVVPTFRRQIQNGGPVTVTDPNMTRFFMTIPEAVSLVLKAAALAHGGEIYVLDMGKPVNIYDLACDMIRLSGYEPEKDIKIEITGLRPGEKLYEELYSNDETVDTTSHEKILVVRSQEVDQIKLYKNLNILRNCLDYNEPEAKQILFDMINNTSTGHGIVANQDTVAANK